MSVAGSDSFDIAAVGRPVGMIAVDMTAVDGEPVPPTTALGILDCMTETIRRGPLTHGGGDQQNDSDGEHAAHVR